MYAAPPRKSSEVFARLPFSDDGSVAKVGNFIQMTGGGGPDGISIDQAGNLVVCQIGLGAVSV